MPRAEISPQNAGRQLALQDKEATANLDLTSEEQRKKDWTRSCQPSEGKGRGFQKKKKDDQSYEQYLAYLSCWGKGKAFKKGYDAEMANTKPGPPNSMPGDISLADLVPEGASSTKQVEVLNKVHKDFKSEYGTNIDIDAQLRKVEAFDAKVKRGVPVTKEQCQENEAKRLVLKLCRKWGPDNILSNKEPDAPLVIVGSGNQCSINPQRVPNLEGRKEAMTEMFVGLSVAEFAFQQGKAQQAKDKIDEMPGLDSDEDSLQAWADELKSWAAGPTTSPEANTLSTQLDARRTSAENIKGEIKTKLKELEKQEEGFEKAKGKHEEACGKDDKQVGLLTRKFRVEGNTSGKLQKEQDAYKKIGDSARKLAATRQELRVLYKKEAKALGQRDTTRGKLAAMRALEQAKRHNQGHVDDDSYQLTYHNSTELDAAIAMNQKIESAVDKGIAATEKEITDLKKPDADTAEISRAEDRLEALKLKKAALKQRAAGLTQLKAPMTAMEAAQKKMEDLTSLSTQITGTPPGAVAQHVVALAGAKGRVATAKGGVTAAEEQLTAATQAVTTEVATAQAALTTAQAALTAAQAALTAATTAAQPTIPGDEPAKLAAYIKAAAALRNINRDSLSAPKAKADLDALWGKLDSSTQTAIVRTPSGGGTEFTPATENAIQAQHTLLLRQGTLLEGKDALATAKQNHQTKQARLNEIPQHVDDVESAQDYLTVAAKHSLADLQDAAQTAAAAAAPGTLLTKTEATKINTDITAYVKAVAKYENMEDKGSSEAIAQQKECTKFHDRIPGAAKNGIFGTAHPPGAKPLPLPVLQKALAAEQASLKLQKSIADCNQYGITGTTIPGDIATKLTTATADNAKAATAYMKAEAEHRAEFAPATYKTEQTAIADQVAHYNREFGIGPEPLLRALQADPRDQAHIDSAVRDFEGNLSTAGYTRQQAQAATQDLRRFKLLIDHADCLDAPLSSEEQAYLAACKATLPNGLYPVTPAGLQNFNKIQKLAEIEHELEQTDPSTCVSIRSGAGQHAAAYKQYGTQATKKHLALAHAQCALLGVNAQEKVTAQQRSYMDHLGAEARWPQAPGMSGGRPGGGLSAAERAQALQAQKAAQGLPRPPGN